MEDTYVCGWRGEGGGEVIVEFDLRHYLQGHQTALGGQVQEQQITRTINSADRLFPGDWLRLHAGGHEGEHPRPPVGGAGRLISKKN